MLARKARPTPGQFGTTKCAARTVQAWEEKPAYSPLVRYVHRVNKTK